MRKTERTHFLRKEAKDVLDGSGAVQDHSLRGELGPELGISQSTRLSKFVPRHFVHLSRSTDEDNALATLSRLDCCVDWSAQERREKEHDEPCSFPLASIQMYPEFLRRIR